ncbi:MerR family transcriptional regulator [Nocardiopsis lambiniae]|uniref:MerR family transcriptional regulator n=1 Tax=Nocardiopsis lambiniae TaxID=3075539 RepID=A0ABU2M7S5_9ACTN|nr:MerR family transcriptional regulator [Nocardiopsis sp. DSM 44743]MDT0328659.1 MerR family transcriptional regulator [Nocardiopsis sp. DSM 44743]
MRIGELSERTGTSRRLLRYYEEQGLIVVKRSPNGYREYDERYVDRVLQIKGLLEAGLPTRIIKRILPCLDQPRAIYVSHATPETIAVLERECDRMNERIRFLIHNRDSISAYLDAVRRGRLPDAPETDPGSEPAATSPEESVGSRADL